MKTHRKQSLALASISLAALFGTASCNVLLGIDGDEYTDVAVEICACATASARFSNCQERVRTELADSEPDARERWLGNYESKRCRTCDTEAVESCLQAEPTCRRQAERCGNELDCCGALAGKAACIEGRCGNCRALGEDCTQSADCCGSIADPGGIYCHAGTCVAEPTGCLESFETCSASEQCCGFEAAVAGCSDATPGEERTCFEACLPDSANCPGCCGRVDVESQGLNVCLGGARFAVALEASGLSVPGVSPCDQLCELGVDENCPLGTQCTITPFLDGALLHLCLPVP